ncbi:MAG: hypothetical protein GY772_06590, partial [bacterium]|nr:hypothetical protein [bacterium]
GARFGLEPECQDAQGFFALWLPQVRAMLEDSWKDEEPGLLDRICPVPEWARRTMSQSRPRDQALVPVDQMLSLHLMGLISDKQWSGQQPLPQALQDPTRFSAAEAGSSTSS